MKNKPLMLALTSVVVLSYATEIAAQPAYMPEPAYQPAEAPPPMPAYQPLSSQQLDQLLGPIALYPDPLLAIMMPAAMFPTQVVTADRYVAGGGDPNWISQQPWDPSVQSLAHYPSVLQYMDDNLNWTMELGQAFLNQQQDVMDSIQRLRMSAQNFGNLQSSPEDQVVEDDGDIEILPVDPSVIYVPTYQPDYVYYRSGFAPSFGISFSIGSWLDHDFDWHHHNLVVWDHDHPRPADWWHERPADRDARMTHQVNIWHPDAHRDVATTHQGDRGWTEPAVRTPEQHNQPIVRNSRPEPAVHPEQSHPEESRPAESHPVMPKPEAPHPQPAHETQPAHYTAPAHQAPPVSSGAFVGGGSSRDARDFSNRGQQSMQAVTHTEPAHSSPPPAPRPAPSAPSGGGSHGGGSQPRH